jgi:hypothetical protein
MAKLTLQVDQLEVESFETAHEIRGRGTIHAHATDAAETCAGHYTCDGTCDQTCGVPASCELVYGYCGTYAEVGCPPSRWMCTVDTDAAGACS